MIATDGTDFETVFSALVAERGGRAALDVVQLNVARALANALVDPATSPATIASLSALLPPKRVEGDGNYDLRRLSDNELAFLQHLVLRATGKKSMPPREFETRDEMEMRDVARMANKAQLAKRYLTPEEIATAKLVFSNCLVCAIRSPVWQIWMSDFSGALWGPLPAPSAVLPAPADAPAEPTEPASKSNVVALVPAPPQQRSIHDTPGGYLAPAHRQDYGDTGRGFSRFDNRG